MSKQDLNEKFLSEDLNRSEIIIVKFFVKLKGDLRSSLAGMYTNFHEFFRQKYVATLLPIRTVGVQGDCRSYSYAVGISCPKEVLSIMEWNDLLYFAKLIPRVCHNINRVTYIFGPAVEHPVTDVTPTMLTPNTIATLRQADNLANQVLNANAEAKAKLSQMPLVLVPIHFDRYDILTKQFLTRKFGCFFK